MILSDILRSSLYNVMNAFLEGRLNGNISFYEQGSDEFNQESIYIGTLDIKNYFSKLPKTFTENISVTISRNLFFEDKRVEFSIDVSGKNFEVDTDEIQNDLNNSSNFLDLTDYKMFEIESGEYSCPETDECGDNPYYKAQNNVDKNFDKLEKAFKALRDKGVFE